MNDFICAMIEFLYKWQTLIGAAIGGFIGLLAALIVAHDARHREERSAAMLVSVDLTSVLAAEDALRELISIQQINSEKEPQWITNQLMKACPTLSGLFEASLLRIMPIDEYMAAHLSLFKTLYLDVMDMVNKLVSANEILRETGRQTLTNQELQSHINLIHSRFLKACEHARCAEPLIDKFILRRTSIFYRIGKHMRIVKYQNACQKLLKKG
ncbi:MAG: hypothetical protein WA240_11580 [Nitrospirota bacterium]